MGARMRAFAWAGTPLGPPAGWPQSLKTIVRVMLDSRFAMWMAWGGDGTFFCNDAYLPTVGLKRDWVLGSRADCVWAEIWHDIGPRIAHVLSTGQATWDQGLQLFLERSGYAEETFHTFSYSPVYDDANRVAGMLCVVTEDTERVIGERRLRLLRDLAALSTSEAESMAMAGELLVGGLAANRFDIPFAALYLADATHAAAHYVAGTPPVLAALAPPTLLLAGSAESPWGVAAAIGSALPQRIDDFAQRCVHVAGAWDEPVHTALVLPLARAGQPRPFGALLLGTSTRRHLDEGYRGFFALLAAQLASGLAEAQARADERRRVQALAELDQAKNLFFGNVSHEFRTPLTLMLGPLEALLDRADVPQDVRETLALVRRNGLRMRKLVNSLLDFSRLEAGRVEASYQPTDLVALTCDLAAVFRAAVEQAGLRFSVDCTPLAEPVYVDRDMWEKVVLNLLSNAFKFTFEGGIALRLRLGGPGVELEVEDTGIGIASAELAQVFDRFHRVKGARSRSQEGTGIGLALVKELVRLHGGTVAVRSAPQRGTVFTVGLPLGSAHLPAARIGAAGVLDSTAIDPASFLDDALRGTDSALGAAGAAMPGGDAASGAPALQYRILVVDDNADMRSYVQRLLAPYGSVATARDGEEALQAIEAAAPDLVVSDVMMPRLDGFGLLQRLRADPRTRALPVILLTAQAGEEARVAGLNRGADDYLVKPFSGRELVARAEVQLMRGRLREIEGALDRRLAEVFRHAPVGMALLRGPDYVYEFANVHYRSLVFGRELIGLPLREALPELHDPAVEQGGDAERLLDSVRASGEPFVGRAVPFRLRSPASGELELRYFDFVYQPLRDEQTPGGRVAVVAFDVTELMQARNQAEQANVAKDEFIAMLGHELRNPLAPIVTALQLMKMRSPEAAVRERDIIGRQVQHMVRLIDDLLDVARIARGRIELKKNVVELAQLVAKAVETASPLLEQKLQRLEVAVPAQGLPVLADSVRLCQVLANLLTNAAKFTDRERAIAVAAVRDGADAVLTVRDEGVGLAPQELGTIFDMFAQGGQDAHRPRGGLGLGLTIARNLATLHGATLTAASEGLGRGSTFTLRIPLHLMAAKEGSGPAPRDALPLSGAASTGKTVLLVDDNVDAAYAMAELLQGWGYQTVVAHDGPQALQLLEQRTVEFGLLDIGLPVMDGYELARRLRSRPGGQAMRLLALTGYGQESDRRRTQEAGFDLHLVKPVDLQRLAQALA